MNTENQNNSTEAIEETVEVSKTYFYLLQRFARLVQFTLLIYLCTWIFLDVFDFKEEFFEIPRTMAVASTTIVGLYSLLIYLFEPAEKE